MLLLISKANIKNTKIHSQEETLHEHMEYQRFHDTF